jgi:hypothetical protein
VTARLVDPPAVIHVPGWGYMVRSKSVEGAFRLVRGNTCSCPAAGARTCRHRRLVAAYCAAEDRAHARPVAPVNPSMFVD